MHNGELIIRPVALDPAAIFGSGWNYSTKAGDTDERSLLLSEVDFGKALFDTCLQGVEKSITSDERLKRLIRTGNIRLDPRFGSALFQEKGHATLEHLYRERNVAYLDFFGQVLVNPRGARCVLCLCRFVDRWYRCVDRFDRVWDERDFSVGFAS